MDTMDNNGGSRSPALGLALAAGGGLAAGAVLAYLLDPKQGARRRAEIRQRTGRLARTSAHVAENRALDVAHRAHGVVAESRARLQASRARLQGATEDDAVLEQRVRARLGRLCSHPAAIEVSCSAGRVQLSGPLLTAEADRVVRGVARVRGVREIDDRTRRHAAPGRVPALQSGAARTNRPRVS